MFRLLLKKCCNTNNLTNQGRFQIYPNRISRQPRRGTGSSHDLKPYPPTKSKKKYVYALGVLLAGATGTVTYAKYDPEFRKNLTENVPGTDKIIKFAFQEEKSYSENIDEFTQYIESISQNMDDFMKYVNSLYENINGFTKDSTSRINKITGNLFGHTDEKPELSEISVAVPKEQEKTSIVKQKDTVKLLEEKVSSRDETDVQNSVNQLGDNVLAAIEEVKTAVKEQADNITKLVDKSIDNEESDVWKKIEIRKEEKQKIIDDVQKKLLIVKENFDKKRSQLSNQNSIKSVIDDISEAMKDLELEKNYLAASEKFANDVQNSRSRINSQLKSLFPGLNVDNKGSKLTPAEVDLFMLYAYSTISNVQKEIKKINHIRNTRLRDALQKLNINAEDLDPRIEKALMKERAKYEAEFQKRKAEIKEKYDKELIEQLKQQTKAHHEFLEEALIEKSEEVEKRIKGKLLQQFEEEKKRYDSSLMTMVTKMKVLNEAVQSRMRQEQRADKARELWASCQDLINLLKSSESDSELKPLNIQISNIQKASVKGDEFVDAVIATIPKKAVSRGVFSEYLLKNRFEKVESIAKRVAQVPEGGTSLPFLFLAFLQSFFILQAIEPIPTHELANKPIDITKLSNYDILQRARYWMDRGDYQLALRYMNLLKGGAKAIAKDWMEEMTMLLETQQAANVLKAYAVASGLIYMK
uniref:MICOS complex subunit MIC60 n=1 Tax=Clastoptera arizonana TaxID=38151 RepID=A0A1B6E8T4_9HEMI